MLLTCRAAMAGLSGGLAALKVAPAGVSSCAGAVAGIDAGQFCRLSEDRNRSLGGDRPDVGRRTGLMIQSFRSGPMCQVKSAEQGALDTRARIAWLQCAPLKGLALRWPKSATYCGGRLLLSQPGRTSMWPGAAIGYRRSSSR